MTSENSLNDWTRWDYVAVGLMILSLLLFFIIGMQLAGIATLFCAMFSYRRGHEQNRAKGINTLSPKALFIGACITGTIAVLLILTHEEDEGSFFDLPSNSALEFDAVDASILCEDAVEARVLHPSTVDMNAFSSSFTENENGRSTFFQTFTAKNSMNLELEFQVRCLFENGNLIDVNISER